MTCVCIRPSHYNKSHVIDIDTFPAIFFSFFFFFLLDWFLSGRHSCVNFKLVIEVDDRMFNLNACRRVMRSL